MNSEMEAFEAGLAEVRDATFANHHDLPDHRAEFPWLTGSLGNPFAPVWFVAENPSLTQVERAIGASPELQWSVSRGDKMLRQALADNGLKSGGPFTDGGWNCYITDVLKSAVRVGDWQGTPSELRDHVAEAWAPAMRYELEQGRPQILVFLGGNAEKFMRHQRRLGLLPSLPHHERIHHYTYIMSRPAGPLGPGHPERVAAWRARVADLAQRYPPRR